MANWSQTHSQGWGDFSEGWEATINGTKFSIVVDERTGRGTLYRSAPGRASTKVKDGSVNELKRYAETLRASRLGQPERFDRYGYEKMASEDFASRLKSLVLRFGFRPDEVNLSGRFGVGTISFKNQKGKATELVSKLRGAMKQMGVPEAAITAREVQYPADADGPAEHWGVVNVDFNKMPHSRPGVKDTMAAGELTTAEAIAKMMEAWKKIEAQAKKQFPNASKEELYRITKSEFEIALKFKFSRPGVKDTMAVEDRFYFGKGRKERFA